jgi:hypothetical protein
METHPVSIESLFEQVESYGKTSYELTRLRLLETTTIVVTSLISALSVIVTISLFVLVLSLGVALWLGDLLGKPYYGFFIVAAFYLLAALVMHFFLSKWIRTLISGLIITQALQ